MKRMEKKGEESRQAGPTRQVKHQPGLKVQAGSVVAPSMVPS